MPQTPDTDRIRLDGPSLEARALLYPEDLREPFIWLGSYFRDVCNRDFDILTLRARKLGIVFDKTTWSKILRGRYNRDATDRPLDTPIVALPKLLKAIDTLRKDSRSKEQGGKIPFVMTPTAQTIFDYIDKKRSPDRVNRLGVIIGETGVQKSATSIEYCLRNNHGTCVRVEAAERASMYKFVSDVAECYGCHPALNRMKKERAINESINERRTLIIENIQTLYDERAGGDQPIFNYIRKLLEDRNPTIIVTYTPDFDTKFLAGRARGFFEQFVGRAGGERGFLRLPAYPTDDDVAAIIKAFGLRESDATLAYCVKVAHEPGRIRTLFEALQEAKIRAERLKESITLGHIKYVRDDED